MEILLLLFFVVLLQFIVLLIVLKNVKHQQKATQEYITSLEQNITNLVQSTFHTISQQILNLKIDNYVNTANKTLNSKEHIYENEFFTQEFGHCKIVKIIDKKDNSITNVYYNENGGKSYTETFNENILTYSAHYQDDRLHRGCEYDSHANLLFEYFYNEIGEVTKRIEYFYAEDGALEQTQETHY
ncbi:hypothetical protein [Sulfurospirillum barnesii]|uniref:hypothetical protein n=1 Tax=Sulfurospirillum barnesii TaxID=44674 RepID=UPI0002F8381B|nr:hypothetical protein [Sulfurospirillum barnesii]